MEIRPWGFFEILSHTPDHKVKRITVNPGGRLSLQRHQLRSEHWYVIEGWGIIVLDGTETEIEEGESIDILRMAKHRVCNNGHAPLVFIEIQTGDYFGEDDIERFEDDYGR